MILYCSLIKFILGIPGMLNMIDKLEKIPTFFKDDGTQIRSSKRLL